MTEVSHLPLSNLNLFSSTRLHKNGRKLTSTAEYIKHFRGWIVFWKISQKGEEQDERRGFEWQMAYSPYFQ